jgi:drug/metabolite transporter (DMT)-like permease
MLIAVFTNGVAIIVIRFVLQKWGAGIVIALTAVYPIVTMILAFVFLKEH